MRQLLVRAALAVITISAGAAAQSQWAVTNLHPAEATESQAYAIDGVQQVGVAFVDGAFRASLWNGTPASWVSLDPVGASSSQAVAVRGGRQAGNAWSGGGWRASLWNGAAASWVNLHPAGALRSFATGVDGGQQAGYARVGGADHASLWSGTANSWVDLHPAGATSSRALAIDSGKQAGYAYVGVFHRASLWSGTAGTWVDLHPAVAGWSEAYAIDGGMQAGLALVGGTWSASLWSGTAGSWVNLHPAGATGSYAFAISGGRQVGYAIVGGVDHASLWSGTAATWVDLHTYLPVDFSSSVALGISTVGEATYVCGYGYNTATSRNEALLWVSTSSIVANPSSFAIIEGSYFGGNVASLAASDDDKLFILNDESETNALVEFVGSQSGLGGGTISLKTETSATRNDLTEFTRAFNYATMSFDLVNSAMTSLTDVVRTVTLGAQYVSSGSEAKCRLQWIPNQDLEAADGWSESVDHVEWKKL